MAAEGGGGNELWLIHAKGKTEETLEKEHER